MTWISISRKGHTSDFSFQYILFRYSSGKVFHPRNGILEKLHEIIKFELEKSGNEKQARRLDALVNTLPEIKGIILLNINIT